MSKYLLIILTAITTITSFAAELYPPEEEMTQPQRILFRSAPLTKIDSDIGLDKIINFPTGAGNAAKEYAQLENTFKTDRTDNRYIELKKTPQGLKLIFKATTIKDCQFAPKYYPYMNEGTIKQPDIIVFLTYFNSMLDIADKIEGNGDIKGAEAVHKRALIFGWQLTQEPPTIVTLFLGLAIKREAAKKYSEFLFRKMDMKGSDQVRKYQEYLEEVGFKYNRIQDYYLESITNFNSIFSTIKIATESEEIIWRQQAILVLGLYRHGIVNSDGVIIARDPKMQKYAENALAYIIENGKTQSERELAAWVVKKLTPEVFVQINRKMRITEDDLQK